MNDRSVSASVPILAGRVCVERVRVGRVGFGRVGWISRQTTINHSLEHFRPLLRHRHFEFVKQTPGGQRNSLVEPA